jgi:hypothetical protein
MTQPAHFLIGEMPVYALSIAGPFARWIASAATVEKWGQKSIEIRSWKISHRSIWVLLHVSQSPMYDYVFRDMPFTLLECPKFTIVGAAILTDVTEYTDAELWERDRSKHCWVGHESYRTICRESGKAPFGHVFTQPILFDSPILNVPGDRAYWQPNPKKPKQEPHQRVAFERAIALIQTHRSTSSI